MQQHTIKLLVLLLGGLTSCSVTNTFYASDPTPLAKGNGRYMVGMSSGIYAEVDKVDTSGTVFYSDKYKVIPNVNAHASWGVGDRTNVNVALQFPALVLGAGGKIGVQYSFFDSKSAFNLAPCAEVGFSASKSTIKIGETTIDYGLAVRTPIHYFDLSLPMSYTIASNHRIIFTPRFSYMRIGVYKSAYDKQYWNTVNAYMPVGTVGYKYKHLLVEASALVTNRFGVVPSIGIGYTSGLGGIKNQ